jgi:hypothetical protein
LTDPACAAAGDLSVTTLFIRGIFTMASPSTTDVRTRGSFKTVVLIALAVLNAAMGLSLVARLVAPNTAVAKVQAGRVSEYAMIPSRPLGVNQDVLYILDTESAQLLVAGYDQTGNRIDFIGPLPLREMLNRR